MTEVSYSDKGGRYTLRCQGHATGSNEACAAVSVLMTTLAGYLENAGGRAKGVWSLEPGLAEITMKTGDLRVIGAWEATLFGLKQLENSFPGYIRVRKT